MRTILWIILIASVCLSGCAGFTMRPPQNLPIPESGTEALYQMVQKTDWLITASILAIGLGAFAFLNGSGVGLKVVSAALVVLSLTLAVARFSTLLAVVAVVIAVGLLGYTIWIKSTAIREIVAGNEAASGSTVHSPLWKIYQRKEQKHQTTERIVDDAKHQIKKRRVLPAPPAGTPDGDAPAETPL